MSTLIFRAREMSLALLVFAVVEHGCMLGGDYSGAAPSSSGLIRLGRDLMRRAGAERTADIAASNWKGDVDRARASRRHARSFVG
jgi:hypothetical protein